MAFCGKCGKQVQDGVTLCPSCENAGQNIHTNDVEVNKPMAIIAYILFFIPLLTGDCKKSPFVKYHTNQGTVLIIVSFVFTILSGILSSIPFVGGIFLLVSLFVNIAPRILGIINVMHGKKEPIPVIGKITIIK